MASPTVREALAWGTGKFREAGLDSPALDMSLILAEVLGCDRLRLYLDLDRPLAEPERRRLRALFDRRLAREPIAYILGRREFFGLPFEVTPAVLIPRPETETLVAAALQGLRARPEETPAPLLADIGTGSGAIAVATAAGFPAARWIATDTSADALEVARRNADANNVADRIEFRLGSLLDPIAEPLDALCSNPPYVDPADRPRLAPDLLDHEPAAALFSDEHGMAHLHALVETAPSRLRPGGLLLLELGEGQSLPLRMIAEATGRYASIDFIRDYAGIERVLRAILAPEGQP